ncbi:hypothetical protein V5O48_013714 [Marasmius crinis-equi]|uniref:Uncharacterized protein n=1 Tax=Marasmius crinis-equi TaxID=585013 RepID=A0ABR3EZA9_9AGAR
MDAFMGGAPRGANSQHSEIENSEPRAQSSGRRLHTRTSLERARFTGSEHHDQSGDESEEQDDDEEHVEEVYQEQDDGEQEDDQAKVDEDGFPVITKPSKDIVRDFEDALSDLDFRGMFAFSKTYEDAPNPCLSLEGLGTVGLPLSQAEAKRLVKKSTQGSFAQGERTGVGRKPIGDTWEVDASKVHFEQTGWKAFMGRVVSEVCRVLGVNEQVSKPRCKLYKLLVHGTGSRILSDVDTEKTKGMFASIIVVLPSQFTGGDAHISHGGLKSVFNTSGPSATKTTVLSWYTDVTPEMEPIRSGYRLALSYNLYHTTTSLRPSISGQLDAFATLRHILLSWKQQKRGPRKIVYLLDHSYSCESLSASILEGGDARMVGLLDSLAKEVGFSLGLAHVEHTKHGIAEEKGEGCYGCSPRGYDSDEMEEDEVDVEMLEVSDEITALRPLVNLDGTLICENVAVNDSSETIPNDFFNEYTGWYDQEYEGYQGECEGTLTRYYRHSALVIWPRWVRLGREKGDRKTVYALQRLQCPDGPEPSMEELDLFDYACRWLNHSQYSSTVRPLCQAARRWKRADLWVQAAATLGDVNLARLLPWNEVTETISQFGFTEAINSDKLRDIVLSDPSITSRLEYLSNLETWACSPRVDVSHNLMLLFVQDMRTHTFDNLPSRTEPSELPFFTDEAFKCGGIQCWKTRLLPQVLKAPIDVEIVQTYAEYLTTEVDQLAPEARDQAHIREVVAELLASALEHLDLFQMRVITTRSPGSSSPAVMKHRGDPAAAMAFIAQCIESGNSTIAFNVLHRMTDLNRQVKEIARARATTVLLPLLELLEEDLQTNLFLSEQREIVEKLLTSIADHLDLYQFKAVTNSTGSGHHYSQSNLRTMVRGDPAPAMSFVTRCLQYGIPTLASKVLQRMKNVGGGSKEVTDARVFRVLLPLLELMENDRKTKSFLSDNQELVTELLASALNAVDLFQIKMTTPNAASWPSYNLTPTTKGNPAPAVSFIARCLESGNLRIASDALRRMADMTGQTSDIAQARATIVLLPLLQLLEKDPKTKPFLSSLPLAGVSEVAIPLALQAVKTKRQMLSEEAVCALLDGAIIGRTPHLLTTAILPEIRLRFSWNEVSWKACIEQLQSRLELATATNNSASSTHISAVAVEMAQRYAQMLALPTEPQTLGYFGTRPPTSQSIGIPTILETCVRLGGTPALKVVLKRVLERDLLADYLESTLIPLIPVLCRLAERQGMAVSAEPFASSLRRIMDNWAKLILGPRPDAATATAAPLFAQLKKFTCSQRECVEVRQFLGPNDVRRTIRLEKMSGPARKHVEKELKVHATTAATFETIRTTPPGLVVKKHNSLYQVARWQTIQQEGVQLLKEIGQDDVLQGIWGDAYPAFMKKMDVAPMINALIAVPASDSNHCPVPTAGPSQVPQSSCSAVPPSVASQGRRATTARQPVSSHTAPRGIAARTPLPHPGPLVRVIPRKRKAEDDIFIDLDSSP